MIIPTNFFELLAISLWVFSGSFGFPGSSVGIIAFAASRTHMHSLIVLILIVYISVVVGDLLAYELAAFFSEGFRERLRKFRFFKTNEEKARKLLKKYGFSIVFSTRFIFTGLCQVVSYLSGFEKISRRKFMSAVLIGEFLFAVIYVSIGFFVGAIVSNKIRILNSILLGGFFLFIVVSAIVHLVKILKKKL